MGALQAPAANTAPFTLVHAPTSYARRAGDFTANLYGLYGRDTRRIRYALNGGPYREVRRELPRVPAHEFLVELSAADLSPGINRLEFQIAGDSSRSVAHEFTYRSDLPALPLKVDWRTTQLDVGDGLWERVERGNTRWIRPRPGHEGYDRTVIVVGAFHGGRRIEIPVVYRGNKAGRPFGFGLHPLWGGRPDPDGQSPRRGWNFSLAGYYSHYKGIGMEFSYRKGGDDPVWIGVYRSLTLQADCEYRLVVELRPELDSRGAHVRYRQRMRFDVATGAGQSPWMELSDSEGAPLQEGEYGIAILAHSCQAEFGPLSVERLPAIMASSNAWAVP